MRPLRGRGLENSYEKHITKVKLLDDAIQKAEPLKSPLTCYRAIPKHVIEDLKVGDIYTDKGYVSLTKDKASANHPGYVHPDDRMILTVKLPAGTKLLDMNVTEIIFTALEPASHTLQTSELATT